MAVPQTASSFRPGETIWFRDRRRRLVGYGDDVRARIRLEREDGDSIVPAAKLGRSKIESMSLASVSR